MSETKTVMTNRGLVFKFLQEHGFAITSVIGLIVVVCYGLFKVDYAATYNVIIGNFIPVALSGLTAPASLVAFLAVTVASKAQWGEVDMLKTYVAIGSIMGLITSVVALIKAFAA